MGRRDRQAKPPAQQSTGRLLPPQTIEAARRIHDKQFGKVHALTVVGCLATRQDRDNTGRKYSGPRRSCGQSSQTYRYYLVGPPAIDPDPRRDKEEVAFLGPVAYYGTYRVTFDIAVYRRAGASLYADWAASE